MSRCTVTRAALRPPEMLAKFETLYALGVRDFAIFFDDIKDKDGAGQAAFLSDVSRASCGGATRTSAPS